MRSFLLLTLSVSTIFSGVQCGPSPSLPQVFISKNGDEADMPLIEIDKEFVHGILSLSLMPDASDELALRGIHARENHYYVDGYPRETAEVFDFEEGANAAYHINRKAFFLNTKGDVLFTLEPVECVRPFKNGLAAIATVSLQNKGETIEYTNWGFIDPQGQYVISPQFDEVRQFSEGVCAVKMDGKWGFCDKQGIIVIPLSYDDALSFSDGLAPVKIPGTKWGFIDKTGQVVIGAQFQDAKPFSEGLAAVSQNGRWGYIDVKGKTVIPIQLFYATRFSEGLAAVATGEDRGILPPKVLWGYMDKSGLFHIEPSYSYAEDFFGGVARVTLAQ